MTYKEKLGYVLSHCELIDMRDQKSGWYITTEGIVGLFAGRGFFGKDELDCCEKVVAYFDKEMLSYKDTMVKDAIKQIGWTPA